MKNKKNLIITASILLVALAIGIYTSIRFTSFRKYQTKFVIREDVVSDVIKFHEYSKNLKGTAGDSEIYVIQGSDNGVAVGQTSSYKECKSIEDLKLKNVYAVSGTTQEVEVRKRLTNLKSAIDEEILIRKLINKEADVIILPYKKAKEFTANNPIYSIFDVEVEKVPSLLVIGGTHPNEPSGQVTATLFLENAKIQRGTLYVITELNKSAYTYSLPQEGSTWYYHIKTKTNKTRTFKFGSRATNTVDQWPTPDVYTHSSGQQLSSSEVRNINRAYPGSENGTYTEQIAYAITNFVNSKDVTMVIDLHEASPEYLTINACVYHQDSTQLINKSRAKAFRYTENGKTKRLDITLDESPKNMHGLTHREVGDYTNAYVFLFETSNASQGKLRGAFTEDLITYSKPDKFYEAAVKFDKENEAQGKDESKIIYGRPVSINERVARHTLSIMSVIEGFNQIGGVTRVVNTTERNNVGVGGEAIGEFKISNIPSYEDISNNGVGYYLLDIE